MQDVWAQWRVIVVVVQLLNHVWLFVTLWILTHQAPLSFSISWSLLKLMSIESVMSSHHLILCCPFSSCPQSFPASGSFPMSQLFRWPKYWNFSFSIIPSSEYSGLISFRIDWCGLFVVQGTLKSLLQHHSLKASVLWHSAFFMVQLSHPYMTTGRTTASTIWTFVGKVISLVFNKLSVFPSVQLLSHVQLFAWGGLSIGTSALASFLPKNTQDWSPLEWTGWISLQSKGLS